MCVDAAASETQTPPTVMDYVTRARVSTAKVTKLQIVLCAEVMDYVTRTEPVTWFT